MGFRPRVRYIDLLTSLGLTTNLKLCVDAGDISSVTSENATKWLDTSGNGYDFNLDAAAGSPSPQFEGTAGKLTPSEFFSLEGGQKFTYDTTNEAWMDSIHKAGAKLTFAAWVKLGDPIGIPRVFFSTLPVSVTDTGARFQSVSTNYGQFQLVVTNAGSTVANIGSSRTDLLRYGIWQFIVFSLNAGVTTQYLVADGPGNEPVATSTNYRSSSGGSTYTSPSSGAATGTFTLCANPSSTNFLAPGSQVAMMCFWDTNLTPTDLLPLYSATQESFFQLHGLPGRGHADPILVRRAAYGF